MPTDDRPAPDAELQRAHTLEAVGQLAGGLAHDFNNLLTAILGYANLLARTFDDDDPRKEDVKEIVSAAERASALTRRLLAFSRQQVLDVGMVDVNRLVTATTRALGRLMGDVIEIVTDLAPDLALVSADESQLEQVLMDLAMNARDAMPTGGRLIVSTSNVTAGEGSDRVHPGVGAGPYVRLVVRDTGVGMSEDVQGRLFEPYFTTKRGGQGGLGLAMVHGIVQQSGGHVVMESEVGVGTTCTVYLPRAGEAPPEANAAPAEPPVAATPELVLVVEDERAVRYLVCTILKRVGYQVVEASGLDEADAWLTQHEEPIGLLITDAIMPGTKGPELVRRARARRPDLKVLFMSGYTGNAIAREQLLEPGVAFIQKPFTAEDLAREVRTLLDR